MKEADALALASKLVKEHLPDKTVAVTLNRRKKSLGYARQGPDYNEISLSREFLHLPDSEIIDTILHEIAHLMVGIQCGHGSEWKRACLAVGARPKPLKVQKLPYTYRYYCPTCKALLLDGVYRRTNTAYLHIICRTRLTLVKVGE